MDEIKQLQEMVTNLIHVVGQTNARLETLETKMDAKLEALENKLDTRYDELKEWLNTRINKLESRMDARFEALEGKFQNMEEELHFHNYKFTRIEKDIFTLSHKPGQ